MNKKQYSLIQTLSLLIKLSILSTIVLCAIIVSILTWQNHERQLTMYIQNETVIVQNQLKTFFMEFYTEMERVALEIQKSIYYNKNFIMKQLIIMK